MISFALVAFGITWIITQSKIFEKFRDRFDETQGFGMLINCPVCTGFWIGMILDLLWYSPMTNVFLSGCYASAVILLLYVIVLKLTYMDERF